MPTPLLAMLTLLAGITAVAYGYANRTRTLIALGTLASFLGTAAYAGALT